MPLTEVPNSPPPVEERDSETRVRPNAEDTRRSGYVDLGTDTLVQRISELEDERRAARIREGIWIALLLHAAFLLLWAFGPRYLLHQPRMVSPAEALKNRKDLAYLDLPPDALKQLKPKNPPAISDKNRVQSSPHPTLDKKTLSQLQAMKPAGPPAQQTPQPQQAQPQQAPQQQPTQPQQAPQQQAQQPPQQSAPAAPSSVPPSPAAPSPLQSLPRQQSRPSQNANNPFRTNESAGDLVRQAARDAAGKGASGGDYGANAPSSHGGMQAGVDILSDTMGVDFGPYMQHVIQATYGAWLPIIPQSARPPLDNKGKVGIEFHILPDGSVKEMILKYPSGDVSLDRAAWGGIKFAGYPPLPKDFKGPFLALRFGFYYNIKPEDDK